ncbi:host attachment protein [Massilia sp.]|uniref:host attachment protein n=1 Tax=Massilia sp. TaxID=1882437 RepID=UPI00289FE255|nr:host attachment protein [Massilia sp.]
MQTTWIMVANAGRARIFSESDPSQPLQEVEDMVSPAAHLRELDLVTDKMSPTSAANTGHNIGGTQGVAGQHNGKAGAPNNQYQPAQTPSEHEAEKFAKDISNYLKQAHGENRFGQLIISASPEFLGTLRKNLDTQVQQLIKHEINKDYTHVPTQQLREQINAQQDKSQ